MKKLKYIFITLMIALVGFLAFSIRNYLPILALGNVSIQENDTFSNDLLIDSDYYSSLDSDSVNLLPKESFYAQDVENTKYNLYNLESKVYTLVDLDRNIGWMNFAIYNGNTELYNMNWRNVSSHTFEMNLTGYTFTRVNLEIKNYLYDSIMLIEGTNVPDSYAPYYRNMFGFSIHSDEVEAIYGLYYVETINNKNYYYLPFDIAENGKVSFNYTFPPNVYVDFNKIVVSNKLNGAVNNKLKLKYYYSNFSLGYKSISFVDINASADNDVWYGLIFQSDPPQVIIQSGKHSVYYSNWKSEIYNFISQDDFIDHYDNLEYSQILGFSSFPDDDDNASRTISFESLVCSSFGSGGGTYIPDDSSNDYESYLPVSGPFDFVPIFTNAFTWIIYHVPIIGPIVNLFRSARVMFTSVVSLGELFSGFGIIFSIFIICLILYIIKKLYGGDN